MTEPQHTRLAQRPARLRALAVAFVAVVTVAGCGSRYNPVNWFDGGAEPPASLEPEGGYAAVALDPRPLIQQVTAMSVEPIAGGVIVRATGLPPTQGFWKAALLPQNDGEPVNGTLTYRFVAIPPVDVRGVGPVQSRQLVVGTFLADPELEGVREIVVQAETNQRVSRR
jgi:hypothetical protein